MAEPPEHAQVSASASRARRAQGAPSVRPVPRGSRISIEEVKTEFGVTKQPVMDAMRRLEAVGIVQIVPQSGCRVAHYTAQEVLDFFNLFGRFEGEVAAAAATRRTDAQLAELDAAWQRIEDLSPQGPQRPFAWLPVPEP